MATCEDCSNKGVKVCWCPTWVSANNGPISLCDECAKPYVNAKSGVFFWGEDAHKAFNSVICFKHSHPLFPTLKQMVENEGKILQGDKIAIRRYMVTLVENHVWLGTYCLISCLGNYDRFQNSPFVNLIKK